MRVALLAVLAVLAFGCKVTAAFQCETHDQCRLGGETGVCELAGYCSFADPSCLSGRRFDSLAGGGLAGTCTRTEVVDAAVDTVDAFDPAVQCPASYTVALPGSSSRYRIIATTATYWAQLAACNADGPGITHLSVLETMQEVMALEAHLDSGTVARVYVGAVQDPQATTPGQGWINFDGSPLVTGLWYPGDTPPEPNDGDNGDGLETDHNSNTLLLDRALNYFHDAPGLTLIQAVCECDGKPIAPMAQQFVDADPNNPN